MSDTLSSIGSKISSAFDDFSFGALGKDLLGLLGTSPLKLGDIGFQGMEIPEAVPFGGSHHLASIILIGGKKIVTRTGPIEADITWSGRFQGSQATTRARALDALRASGKKVTLTWGSFSRSVIVKEFRAAYERFYQIPYSITLEVIAANASTGSNFLSKSLNDIIGKDTLSSLGLSNLIGDATLGDSLSKLQSGLTVVGQLTGSKAIGKIAGYATAAQGIANGIANSNSSSILGMALGGAKYAVGNPSLGISSLSTAVTATSALANTTTVSNLLGRITKNLGS